MVFSSLKSIYSKINSIFVKKANVDYTKIPKHIAIIMDGNGRWAKSRGLSRSAGHAAGAETLRVIAEFAQSIGIKSLTAYAFSTENWSRPKEEVDALMELMYKYLSDAENLLAGRNNIVRIIGDTSRLSDKIRQRIKEVEEMTKNNTGMFLNLAINYGGRDEIVNAVKKISGKVLKGEIDVNSIDEKTLSENMYTYYTSDPDIIIRPSGEKRLSNFLLWQAAYSEFWYASVAWPDFTSKHLLLAIEDFQKRNRRYGGV